jgi:hypothetical protein
LELLIFEKTAYKEILGPIETGLIFIEYTVENPSRPTLPRLRVFFVVQKGLKKFTVFIDKEEIDLLLYILTDLMG